MTFEPSDAVIQFLEPLLCIRKEGGGGGRGVRVVKWFDLP